MFFILYCIILDIRSMEVLVQEFIQHLRTEKRYSDHTLVAYQHDLESFSLFAQEEYGLNLFETKTSLESLKLNHLRAWVGFLSNDLAKSSIHRKVSAIKSLLNFCIRKGIIKKNPSKNLILPKRNKPLPVFVPESQMIHFMDEANWNGVFNQVRNQLIFELLYGCGLRRSECCSIQYSNIDKQQKLLRIFGKGKKERFVPFGNKVLKAMQEYEDDCLEKGLNFKQHYLLTEKGKPMYAQLLYRVVRETLVRSLVLQKNSPHVLRHTFATHILDRGADLNAVKEFLGHSSLSSTQIYTHNTLSRLKSVHKLAHPKS